MRPKMSVNPEPSSGYACTKLPFCQHGNSCCAVSLYAALAIGTELGNESRLTAEVLYSNSRKFQRFLQYGYLLWKIAVVTERTDSIIDALVDVRSEARGNYAISEKMRSGHYMYASLEEAFLKCLNSVVEVHTRDLQINPALADIALLLERPINTVHSSSMQMVDSLVRHCLMLQGTVVTDRREYIMEMVFDRASAEVQKRYRLLQSIFAECPDHRQSLNALELELMQLYAGTGNPHNFSHLVMKHCDFAVWTMYLCPIKELVHYDRLLRGSRQEWFAEVYEPLFKQYPESCMFMRNQDDEAEVCTWLLANLEHYLDKHNYRQLCNPTRSQIMPAVHFVLLTARTAFLSRLQRDPQARMSERVHTHWDMTVDPLCAEELFENAHTFRQDGRRTASFVITASNLRSFSVHAFFEQDSTRFLLFDSHGDSRQQCAVYLANSTEGIATIVKTCAGGQRCDVNFVAATADAAQMMRDRHVKLNKFFSLYSYDFKRDSKSLEDDDTVAFEPLGASFARSDGEEASSETATFILEDGAESDEAQELEVEI